MGISVCIPAWNRDKPLERCLNSLKNQTYKDYEIVIGEHPVIATARNLAVKKAKEEFLVFIDADIILNPYALEHYHNLLTPSPEAVIAGMYHWLPPLLPVDSVDGIVGNDPRLKKGLFDSSVIRDRFCLDFYSGNFGISKKLYNAIGGMDEEMTGHGGEDCEFAIRLQKAGHKAIFSPEVVGFHVYHERNQEKNMAEVQVNIDYIAKKHDLESLSIKKGKKGELPLVYK